MSSSRRGVFETVAAAAVAIALIAVSAPAAGQEVTSEARLGNVVIDCAELPPQVQRQLPPCREYYEWSQDPNGNDGSASAGADPVVTLSNGMTFRCSELGAVAAQIPECQSAPAAPGAVDSLVERP